MGDGCLAVRWMSSRDSQSRVRGLNTAPVSLLYIFFHNVQVSHHSDKVLKQLLKWLTVLVHVGVISSFVLLLVLVDQLNYNDPIPQSDDASWVKHHEWSSLWTQLWASLGDDASSFIMVVFLWLWALYVAPSLSSLVVGSLVTWEAADDKIISKAGNCAGAPDPDWPRLPQKIQQRLNCWFIAKMAPLFSPNLKSVFVNAFHIQQMLGSRILF